MDGAKWYADGRIVCIGGKQDCAEVGLDGRAEKICEWHNSEVSALQSALSAEVKSRVEAEVELMDERIAHVWTQADAARLRDALAAILFGDELVEANEGAVSIHALRRVKEIAALALASEPGGCYK